MFFIESTTIWSREAGWLDRLAPRREALPSGRARPLGRDEGSYIKMPKIITGKPLLGGSFNFSAAGG